MIAAVASIGYFQVYIAPSVFTTSSALTVATSSSIPASQVVNVTIFNGASSEPAGYTQGATTQYGFTPDVITVVIGKNNTINWINNDLAPHTATSDLAGVFDTGAIAPGASAEVTLSTPGTYTYHCSFHPWMQGTVIVKSG